MSRQLRITSALASVLAFGLLAPLMSTAAAAYSLCALRDGPRGPCTCRSTTDGPGQFTEVSKSRCRSAAVARKAKDDADAENARKATAKAGAEAPVSASTEDPGAVDEDQRVSNDEGDTSLVTAALPDAGGKLDEVRARGKLICGVNTGLLGFSVQTGAGRWAGIDVDYCRGLAAAVLGDADKVAFVPLETNERFDALKHKKIDVLARNATWTMEREVDLGLRFAGILYFDGQGFMTREERGLVSAQQLAGSKVCVEAGTTTETNMAYYFKAHDIAAETMVFPTREETLKAYAVGDCDAYSSDRSALYADRASFASPEEHAILPEIISKEPLGPVVLKGDDEWIEIVRWTLAGLVNAEEVGLDRGAARGDGALSDDAQRLVSGAGASGKKLRLEATWLRDVIAAVGNYGEMFEENVGKKSPLGMERGLNALWKRGGILSAPPMW